MPKNKEKSWNIQKLAKNRTWKMGNWQMLYFQIVEASQKGQKI